MTFVNPITPAVRTALDTELPLAVQAGASVATLFSDAYNQLIAHEARVASEDMFSYDELLSSGLSFAYHDGIVGDGAGGYTTTVAGTVTLTDAATNYLEWSPVTGLVTANTTGFTAGSLSLYTVVTSGGAFTSATVTDYRPGSAIIAGQCIAAANLQDEVADMMNEVDVTVGVEASNHIDVSIQVLDAQGNDLADYRVLEVWLSDTDDGWETATAPDGGISVETGTAFDVVTAGKRIRVKTDNAGLAVVRVSETGTPTWYMGIRIQDKAFYSDEITFV